MTQTSEDESHVKTNITKAEYMRTYFFMPKALMEKRDMTQTSGTFPELTKRTPKGKGKKR